MTSGFPGCRPGRPDDLDRLYQFLLPMWDENGLFPLSEARSRAQIATCLSGDKAIAGIIEGPRGIEASIGMISTKMWYTDQHHVQEIWMYVGADYRTTSHARTLIGFGKWVSDELASEIGTAVPWLFGMVSRKRLAQKMRLYQRSAPQIGAMFMYGLEPPHDQFNQRKVADFSTVKAGKGGPDPATIYVKVA